MKRVDWLKEKRLLAEERYDKIFSLKYDEKWGYINLKHKENLNYIINLLPKNSKILDAACGTGKYWGLVSFKDFIITGIDQSQKMLDISQNKFPNIQCYKLGLQELFFENEFNCVICIDAMENICPEDWSKVIENFYNCLQNNGYLYFTVETISDEEKAFAFQKGLEMNAPLLKGEYIHEGGYHYYPKINDVKNILSEKNFTIIKENTSDGYHHFIAKKHTKII